MDNFQKKKKKHKNIAQGRCSSLLIQESFFCILIDHSFRDKWRGRKNKDKRSQ